VQRGERWIIAETGDAVLKDHEQGLTLSSRGRRRFPVAA
jgi:hypothetical protein